MMALLGVLSVLVVVGLGAGIGWLRGDPNVTQDRGLSALGGALFGLIVSFAVVLPLAIWADVSGFTF